MQSAPPLRRSLQCARQGKLAVRQPRVCITSCLHTSISTRYFAPSAAELLPIEDLSFVPIRARRERSLRLLSCGNNLDAAGSTNCVYGTLALVVCH